MVVQILHLDLEAIMNDFSTSRIIVVLLFCWIYVFVARNGKIVLHRLEDIHDVIKEAKVLISKVDAPGEAPTQSLQIMILKRCLLHY